jgi:hypothetical protein
MTVAVLHTIDRTILTLSKTLAPSLPSSLTRRSGQSKGPTRIKNQVCHGALTWCRFTAKGSWLGWDSRQTTSDSAAGRGRRSGQHTADKGIWPIWGEKSGAGLGNHERIALMKPSRRQSSSRPAMPSFKQRPREPLHGCGWRVGRYGYDFSEEAKNWYGTSCSTTRLESTCCSYNTGGPLKWQGCTDTGDVCGNSKRGPAY